MTVSTTTVTPQGVKGGLHLFKKGSSTYRFSDEDLAVLVGYAIRENKRQQFLLKTK